MTVAFDTLKLARRLEAAGFPTKQAQDTAEALAETLTANVASQADIQAVQGDIRELGLQLRGEINQVRAEINGVRAEVRELELRLRADMASLRAELIKWVVGVGVAAVIAAGGMMVTLGVAVLRALPHP
jgi:predicted  nucleic acid-binding Zn-ribbon protein